ncbi:Uncharacterised protein [BD1-7 clade bacterium]|uniref:Uncharacterized protein n=1 Tax=BD1-7 clade bacterium TaxID=2029982 RepID=A0A5S9QFW6_9GAMM|nr:Uncharacterised protein [BD1-7 clade bacterium]
MVTLTDSNGDTHTALTLDNAAPITTLTGVTRFKGNNGTSTVAASDASEQWTITDVNTLNRDDAYYFDGFTRLATTHDQSGVGNAASGDTITLSGNGSLTQVSGKATDTLVLASGADEQQVYLDRLNSQTGQDIVGVSNGVNTTLIHQLSGVSTFTDQGSKATGIADGHTWRVESFSKILVDTNAFTLNGFDQITSGGTAVDTFTLNTLSGAGALALDAGSEDILDFSERGNVSLEVDSNHQVAIDTGLTVAGINTYQGNTDARVSYKTGDAPTTGDWAVTGNNTFNLNSNALNFIGFGTLSVSETGSTDNVVMSDGGGLTELIAGKEDILNVVALGDLTIDAGQLDAANTSSADDIQGIKTVSGSGFTIEANGQSTVVAGSNGNTWNVTAVNTITDTNNVFKGFNQLDTAENNGNDTINIVSTAVANDWLAILTVGGTDVLDYSNYTPGNVTVDLHQNKATGLADVLGLRQATVIADSGATLITNATAQTWTVSAGDLTGSSVGSADMVMTGFDHLQTDQNNIADTIVVADGGVLASLKGGTGDALHVGDSALQINTDGSIGGKPNQGIASITGINSFTGNGANTNTVTGSTVAETWTLSNNSNNNNERRIALNGTYNGTEKNLSFNNFVALDSSNNNTATSLANADIVNIEGTLTNAFTQVTVNAADNVNIAKADAATLILQTNGNIISTDLGVNTLTGVRSLTSEKGKGHQITGSSLAETYTLAADDTLTITGDYNGQTTTLNSSGIDHLITDDTHAETITLQAGGSLQQLTADGKDTLDFANIDADFDAVVTLTDSNGDTQTALTLDNAAPIATLTGVTRFKGNNGTSTVAASDASEQWTITDANMLNRDNTYYFDGFTHLATTHDQSGVGNAANGDTITLSGNGSLAQVTGKATDTLVLASSADEQQVYLDRLNSQVGQDIVGVSNGVSTTLIHQLSGVSTFTDQGSKATAIADGHTWRVESFSKVLVGSNAFTLNDFDQITSSGTAVDTFTLNTLSGTGALKLDAGSEDVLDFSERGSVSLEVDSNQQVAIDTGLTVTGINTYQGNTDASVSYKTGDAPTTGDWAVTGNNTFNLNSNALNFIGFGTLDVSEASSTDNVVMSSGGSLGELVAGQGDILNVVALGNLTIDAGQLNVVNTSSADDIQGIKTVSGSGFTIQANNQSKVVAGSDTDTWNVTAVNTITDTNYVFKGFNQLDTSANDGTDTVNIMSTAVVNDWLAVLTVGNTDVLDYSNYRSGNVIVDLHQGKATGISSVLGLRQATVTADSGSTLIADATAQTWTVSASDLTGSSVGSADMVMTGFDHLQTDQNNIADTIVVADGGVLASLKGGTGDALHVGDSALQINTDGSIGGKPNQGIASIIGINSFTGNGAATNTLVGSSVAEAWNLSNNNDERVIALDAVYNGQQQNLTFNNFVELDTSNNNANTANADTVNILGSITNAFTTVTVNNVDTVNIASANAATLSLTDNGDITSADLGVGTLSGVRTIVSTQGRGHTLSGAGIAETFTVSAGSQLNVTGDYSGQTHTLNTIGMDGLVTSDDYAETITLESGGSLQQLTADGADTLNFASIADQDAVITLIDNGGDTEVGLTLNGSTPIATLNGVQRFTGNNTRSTVVGSTAAETWTVTSANQLSQDDGYVFDSFGSLRTSHTNTNTESLAAADRIVVNEAGSLVELNAGAFDTIDLSAHKDVSVNVVDGGFTSAPLTNFSGGKTIVGNGAASVVNAGAVAETWVVDDTYRMISNGIVFDGFGVLDTTANGAVSGDTVALSQSGQLSALIGKAADTLTLETDTIDQVVYLDHFNNQQLAGDVTGIVDIAGKTRVIVDQLSGITQIENTGSSASVIGDGHQWSIDFTGDILVDNTSTLMNFDTITSTGGKIDNFALSGTTSANTLTLNGGSEDILDFTDQQSLNLTIDANNQVELNLGLTVTGINTYQGNESAQVSYKDGTAPAGGNWQVTGDNIFDLNNGTLNFIGFGQLDVSAENTVDQVTFANNSSHLQTLTAGQGDLLDLTAFGDLVVNAGRLNVDNPAAVGDDIAGVSILNGTGYTLRSTGQSRVIAGAAPSNWNITGAAMLSDGRYTFDGFNALDTSTNNVSDIVNMVSGSTIDGSSAWLQALVLDSIDMLDYTAYTPGNVVVDLHSETATGIASVIGLHRASVSSDSNASLTAGATAQTWTVADNELTSDSGTVLDLTDDVQMIGFDHLITSTNGVADAVKIDQSGTLVSLTGAADDLLNVGSGGLQIRNDGSLGGIANHGIEIISGIQHFVGNGAFSNRITGSNTAENWLMGANGSDRRIEVSAAYDNQPQTYQFDNFVALDTSNDGADIAIGSADTITIANGIDTDYEALVVNQSDTVDVAAVTDALLQLQADGSITSGNLGVKTLTGARTLVSERGSNQQLIGADIAETYSIAAGDQLTITADYDSSPTTLSVTGIDHLNTADSHAETVFLENGGSLQQFTADSADLLDVSNIAGDTLVTLSESSNGIVQLPQLRLKIDNTTPIETIAGLNRVTGNNTRSSVAAANSAEQWTITGENRFDQGGYFFDGFNTLTTAHALGGSETETNADVIVVAANASLENLNAGSEDRIDLSAHDNVEITLTNDGFSTDTLASASGGRTIVGAGSGSRVNASAAAEAWSISGVSRIESDTRSFEGFSILDTTAGQNHTDTIQLIDGGSIDTLLGKNSDIVDSQHLSNGVELHLDQIDRVNSSSTSTGDDINGIRDVSGVRNFVAAGGQDTVIADGRNWTVDAANHIVTDSFVLDGYNNLDTRGGSVDQVTMTADANQAGVRGQLSQVSGDATDQLLYSNYGEAVILDLANTEAVDVGADSTGIDQLVGIRHISTDGDSDTVAGDGRSWDLQTRDQIAVSDFELIGFENLITSGGESDVLAVGDDTQMQSITGDAGIDRLDASAMTQAVDLILANLDNQAQGDFAGIDQLSGIHRFIGNQQNLSVTASSEVDRHIWQVSGSTGNASMTDGVVTIEGLTALIGDGQHSLDYTGYSDDVELTIKGATDQATGIDRVEGISNYVVAQNRGSFINQVTDSNYQVSNVNGNVTLNSSDASNQQRVFSGFGQLNIEGGQSNTIALSDNVRLQQLVGDEFDVLDYSAVTTAVSLDLRNGDVSQVDDLSGIVRFVGNNTDTQIVAATDSQQLNWQASDITVSDQSTQRVYTDSVVTVSGLTRFVGNGEHTMDFTNVSESLNLVARPHQGTLNSFSIDNLLVFGVHELSATANAVNTFTGADLASNFQLTGENLLTYSQQDDADRTLSVSGFQNITTGAAADRIVMNDGASIQALSGDSTDVLSYANVNSNVDINLAEGNATGISLLQGVQHFEGSQNAVSRFSANNAARVWVVDGEDRFQADDNSISATDFDVLVTGSERDTIRLSDQSVIDQLVAAGDEVSLSQVAGSNTVHADTGSIVLSAGDVGFTGEVDITGNGQTIVQNDTANGNWSVAEGDFITFGDTRTQNIASVQGSGSDTVSYDGYNQAVNVDLESSTSNVIGIFSGISQFVGDTALVADNTVVGSNTDTQWLVTGSNAFTEGDIEFSNFAVLNTGGATDVIELSAVDSSLGRVVGDASDTIRYSESNRAVTINVDQSSATGIDVFEGITQFDGNGANTEVISFDNTDWLVADGSGSSLVTTLGDMRFTQVGALTAGGDAKLSVNVGRDIDINADRQMAIGSETLGITGFNRYDLSSSGDVNSEADLGVLSLSATNATIRGPGSLDLVTVDVANDLMIDMGNSLNVLPNNQFNGRNLALIATNEIKLGSGTQINVSGDVAIETNSLIIGEDFEIDVAAERTVEFSGDIRINVSIFESLNIFSVNDTSIAKDKRKTIDSAERLHEILAETEKDI